MKLNDLEALAIEATPGPWHVEDFDLWDVRGDGEPGVPLLRGVTDTRRSWGRERDAGEVLRDLAYIAAVNPQVVLALIAEYRALTAERDRLIVERDAAYRDGHRAGAQRDADLRRIYDALPRGPRCRDCADEDGRCPSLDRPCDPADWVIEIIRAASIGAGDDGWRPIETAPKDGTTFWAAKTYPNRRFRPDYFECAYSQTSYLGSLIDGRDSDTRGRWHNRSANKWDDPSHWRPLPPAPAATDPEGE